MRGIIAIIVLFLTASITGVLLRVDYNQTALVYAKIGNVQSWSTRTTAIPLMFMLERCIERGEKYMVSKAELTAAVRENGAKGDGHVRMRRLRYETSPAVS
jgi:hypothetical protein